jgi:hypothetical protein
MKRSALSVVLLALLVVAGACSSGSTDEAVEAGDTQTDTADSEAAVPGSLAFADVVSGTAAADTGRFEGTYTITDIAAGEEATAVELTVEGAFDDSTESMDMTMHIGDYMASGLVGEEAAMLAGFEDYLADPLRLITIGDEGWISWSLMSLLTGQPDAWLVLDDDGMGSMSEGFGFTSQASNPTDLLAGLVGAEAKVEDLGVETVRGEETQHLQALVDLATLADGLDPMEQAALEGQVGPLSDSAYPMDLWVGVDDGLIRRYVIEVPAETFAVDEATMIGPVEIVMEVYDYGTDVGITPPPADQVVSGTGLLMP